MLKLLLLTVFSCITMGSSFPASQTTTACPVALTNCLRNPCEGAPCPLRRTATCVPNYCGGCYDTWYENGKRVYCWGP